MAVRVQRRSGKLADSAPPQQLKPGRLFYTTETYAQARETALRLKQDLQALGKTESPLEITLTSNGPKISVVPATAVSEFRPQLLPSLISRESEKKRKEEEDVEPEETVTEEERKIEESKEEEEKERETEAERFRARSEEARVKELERLKEESERLEKEAELRKLMEAEVPPAPPRTGASKKTESKRPLESAVFTEEKEPPKAPPLTEEEIDELLKTSRRTTTTRKVAAEEKKEEEPEMVVPKAPPLDILDPSADIVVEDIITSRRPRVTPSAKPTVTKPIVTTKPPERSESASFLLKSIAGRRGTVLGKPSESKEPETEEPGTEEENSDEEEEQERINEAAREEAKSEKTCKRKDWRAIRIEVLFAQLRPQINQFLNYGASLSDLKLSVYDEVCLKNGLQEINQQVLGAIDAIPNPRKPNERKELKREQLLWTFSYGQWLGIKAFAAKSTGDILANTDFTKRASNEDWSLAQVVAYTVGRLQKKNVLYARFPQSWPWNLEPVDVRERINLAWHLLTATAKIHRAISFSDSNVREKVQVQLNRVDKSGRGPQFDWYIKGKLALISAILGASTAFKPSELRLIDDSTLSATNWDWPSLAFVQFQRDVQLQKSPYVYDSNIAAWYSTSNARKLEQLIYDVCHKKCGLQKVDQDLLAEDRAWMFDVVTQCSGGT